MAAVVEIIYFAQLRDSTQKESETLQLEDGDTALSVYTRLSHKYGFTLSADELRVAVNDEFSQFDHSLSGGETLVFLPPVAGG